MENLNTSNASVKAKKIMKSSMHNSINGRDIGEKISSTYEGIKEQVSGATRTSVSFVKKYPLRTLAGVAAVGIAAGIYLRSRKNIE
jgi:ElaB/YqjD/DUF883 family membrane-anchored ribosome-binding protein